MTQYSVGRDHTQVQLGLYVLGALSPDESAAVDAHVAECAQCRTESARLGEVPAFLSMLTSEQVRSIADAFPPPPRPDAHRTAAHVIGVHRPRAGSETRRPSGGGDSARTQAQARSDGSRRPPTRASLRLGRRTSFWLVLTATALVLGVGVGLRLASSSPTVITLAGTETDTVTGATMSVGVVGADMAAHVNATVKGLRPGVEYELYAVDATGRTQVIARWLGEDKPYTYVGDLSVRVDKLAFFTIRQNGGGVVITVKVAKSSQGMGLDSNRPVP